jgi:hypothetical protein
MSIVVDGAFSYWWYQNIEWPRQWAGRIDQTTFEVFRSKHLRPSEAAILIGILVICALPAIVRRLRPSLPRWVDWAWVVALASVGYLGYTWIRPCLLLPTGAGGGAWTLVIVVVVILAAAWLLIQRGGQDGEVASIAHARIVMAAVALGSLAQLYPVPCMNHTFWSVAPVLGYFVHILWRWTGMREVFCGVLLAVLLIPAAHDKYTLSRYSFGLNTVELQAPLMLKGMRVAPEQAGAYTRLDGVLRRAMAHNIERPGILYGNDALYLTFFKNGTNPSPYYVEWPELASRAERVKRLDFLIREKPVVIFHEREAEMVTRFMAVITDVGYRVVTHEPELNVWIALPVAEAERDYPALKGP